MVSILSALLCGTKPGTRMLNRLLSMLMGPAISGIGDLTLSQWWASKRIVVWDPPTSIVT